LNNDIEHLRETIKISLASRAAGNHPFGSLLVGPDEPRRDECRPGSLPVERQSS
jgi:hypothetical protein